MNFFLNSFKKNNFQQMKINNKTITQKYLKKILLKFHEKFKEKGIKKINKDRKNSINSNENNLENSNKIYLKKIFTKIKEIIKIIIICRMFINFNNNITKHI